MEPFSEHMRVLHPQNYCRDHGKVFDDAGELKNHYGDYHLTCSVPRCGRRYVNEDIRGYSRHKKQVNALIWSVFAAQGLTMIA